MKNTIKIAAEFIITAIEDGKPVFYAIDQHSGGYPYWSGNLSSAHRFVSVNAASKSLPMKGVLYMLNRVTDLCIGAVRTTIDLTEIDQERITKERKQAALDKLTADDRRLLGLE